ncbi:hypothetical protein BX616_002936 [Lobosporangium transversale]|uniref:Dienelactone hydrolase domain-containing protein n=1 Tax=Lobosporangium transversale TaxID=64571 RepID=A0A1Y2GMI0_9FUNG|nr:hypothetical protein BCR41DRAFT_386878 [Lobosporangium transversale]KAF9899599.1 hypothetical protein BX616_002936 [Lobosporangium transversale]ORZ14307.1 hypothetical protein BCR41DRAFT_386878 [Lobosporangium transversale]|eukprot:XP_021880785.1 hypothetical protein BCR41DRAFT_386878 [Lobosporangium transversale]
MSLTESCCNTPPVQDAQWHNKGEQVALSQQIAGEERTTYRTGPKDSKRGLIAIYDIFAYHPTTYQFFDRIAESHGGFQLSAPHIFTKGGYPPDQMGDSAKLMAWIGANGDYKGNHIDEIIRVAVEDLRKDGCTSFSIFGQCWGALMSVKAASEEGNPFLAAGGPHPSFFSIETVKDTKAPLIILASKDEADMVPVIDSIKHKNFPVEPFHKRFDNMHHGWTGGRGDWSQPDQFQAGLEAVDLLSGFFAKAASASKL